MGSPSSWSQPPVRRGRQAGHKSQGHWTSEDSHVGTVVPSTQEPGSIAASWNGDHIGHSTPVTMTADKAWELQQGQGLAVPPPLWLSLPLSQACM